MTQTNLGASQQCSNEVNSQSDSWKFGGECNKKPKHTVRIMFQNVNGLGYSHTSVKSNSIRKLMVKKEVDVMAIAETGINWSKVKRSQTLQQVCKIWFERSKTTVSYNQYEKRKKNKHQPGGTAVIARGDLALRHHKNEYDVKKLGRWASQDYQGKGGIITRVVSVYVPNPMQTHGPKKVACQQQKACIYNN